MESENARRMELLYHHSELMEIEQHTLAEVINSDNFHFVCHHLLPAQLTIRRRWVILTNNSTDVNGSNYTWFAVILEKKCLSKAVVTCDNCC